MSIHSSPLLSSPLLSSPLLCCPHLCFPLLSSRFLSFSSLLFFALFSSVFVMSNEFNPQTTFYGSFLFVYVCGYEGDRQSQCCTHIPPSAVATNSVFIYFACISVSCVIDFCFLGFIFISCSSCCSTAPPRQSMLKLCRECMNAIRLIVSLFSSLLPCFLP